MVLDRDIQYWSGEGTFSGRRSPRAIILNSNSGGVVVGGRLGSTGLMLTAHTPGGYHPNAKDLMFYFISYTKVGLFISFSGCLGVLAGVCCFWRVFAGPCQAMIDRRIDAVTRPAVARPSYGRAW